MIGPHPRPIDEPGDSPSELDRVVSALLNEEAGCGPIADEVIKKRFPRIGDELCRAMRDARAIAHVARKSSSHQADTASSGTHANKNDELNFLQEALPDFDLLDAIGSGGQGTVFKAVQKSTGRIVALKVLLGHRHAPRHIRRFKRELDIAGRLNHPNIVSILDAGTALGRPYYVMQYVDGLPIDTYVSIQRPSIPDRVRLFKRVCDAVTHAHARGIVHRDLKSPNILVDMDGQPHVLDFGLAKFTASLPEPEMNQSVSMQGQIIGTLPYLSPEQAQGTIKTVDKQSDAYSLGVVLYQLLTGSFPYSLAGTSEAVRQRIIHDEPMRFSRAIQLAELLPYDEPPELPDDLEQIVRKALAKDKDRRYASVAEFAEDLERFLNGLPVEAKADSALYVLRKRVRRYRIQLAVITSFLVVLLAGLIGVGVLWQRSRRLAAQYAAALQAGAFVRTGQLQAEQDHFEEAQLTMQKASEISRAFKLIENEETTPMAVEVHIQLMDLLTSVNDYNEARNQGDEYFAIAQQQYEANPTDKEWQRIMGYAYFVRGRLLTKMNREESAIQHLEKALALRESAFAREPRTRLRGVQLAATCSTLGDAYKKFGKFDLALANYQRTIDIIRNQVHEFPKSIPIALILCHAEMDLGNWHFAMNTSDHNREALKFYKQVQARLDDIKARDSAASIRIRERMIIQSALDHNLRGLYERAPDLKEQSQAP